MKKYVTKGMRIEVTEIERETESSVWINGRRSAKHGAYENFFNTWDDAHSHLMKRAQSNVDQQRRILERLNGVLGNIKGMKRPDGAA